MIFRKLTWLTPMIPLITIDARITIDINTTNFILYINKTMGAIFCHVKINKQFIQSRPSITSGNQKWNGAIPIFVKSLEFIINRYVDWRFIFVVILELFISRIIDIRMIVEAIDCTIKYLIADSADNMFFWLCISGMMDSRLISNPNHIPSQEYEEIEIIVLIMTVERNRIL